MGIIEVFAGGVVTRDQQEALITLEATVMQAIQGAQDAGVPQGLIVAVLHGHAHQQTAIMIGN